jgi:lipopolysaccharide export system permease protein
MVFFLLMQFVWKYVDDLVGKGVEWYYILEMLLYISATTVPLALPISVLLSSLMTFGSFGEHNELAAMRASGISLLRLFRVLIITVIIISIGGFLFANYVMPVSQFKGKSLLRNITKMKPALNIRPGIFYNGIEGYSIKIAEKGGPDKNELKNIIIYDHTDNLGNIKVTTADEGLMDITPDNRYMIIRLRNGQTYEEHQPTRREEKERKPFSSTQFEYAVIRFSLEDFESEDLRQETRKDFNMLNNAQLVEAIDSLRLVVIDQRSNFHKTMAERYGYILDTAARPPHLKDTVIEIHPDIMANFSERKRKMVAENALRIARSNRSYYDQAKTNYHWRERNITRHVLEWHKKLSLSFACLVMFFIGAPLGAIIRKGGMGMPVVISVVVFILFYVMATAFEKMGRELTWQAIPAMWLPPLLFLPIGLLLTYKTANDAQFMSMEFWIKIWRKITNSKRQS